MNELQEGRKLIKEARIRQAPKLKAINYMMDTMHRNALIELVLSAWLLVSVILSFRDNSFIFVLGIAPVLVWYQLKSYLRNRYLK